MGVPTEACLLPVNKHQGFASEEHMRVRADAQSLIFPRTARLAIVLPPRPHLLVYISPPYIYCKIERVHDKQNASTKHAHVQVSGR